jgi:hypothetical protein
MCHADFQPEPLRDGLQRFLDDYLSRHDHLEGRLGIRNNLLHLAV